MCGPRKACPWLLLTLGVLGLVVLSDITWRERRQAKHRADNAKVEKVDMGVVLHTVVQDPSGEELVRNKPKLRIIRSHRRGAMLGIDADGYRWIGRSDNPRVWYCSEDAEPLILHGDDLPDNLLVFGSEGAGKTDAQSKWCWFRCLERISQNYAGSLGMSAPVAERLGLVKEAIVKNWSPAWYRWNERHSEFRLPTGLRVKLRATKQQSEASGSPWQGYNFSDAGNDEIQDSLDANDDIESRLRDAPDQRGKRFATCTAKDSPDFRTWRDSQLSATLPDGRKVWHLAKMLVSRSPFTTPHFLEKQRATMSWREYQRRFEAKDMGPEKQVYHAWARSVELADGRKLPGNLRRVPDVGAVGVTARELSRFGQGLTLLAGHDPGKRQDVTLFLRAYEFANVRMPDGKLDTRPRWFVVDEITTEGETHETHVQRVLKIAREKYRLHGVDMKGRPDPDSGRLVVRIDPHTRSGDEHPGQDLYAIWRQKGFTTYAAAYAPGTTNPLSIKPESRIELINTLLCDASIERTDEGAIVKDGVRRLFVACDERGKPCAPKLVEAFETMERDGNNRAEWERKDGRDKSHWGAALAYSLWAIERPRVSLAGEAAS